MIMIFKNFRIIFLIFLFFALRVPSKSGCPCSGILVSGSYLKVNQLGYGWLVPDEQVDIDYNPANLNNIIGQRLFLGSGGDKELNYHNNNRKENYGMYFFTAFPVVLLKFAFRYKPIVASIYEKYEFPSSTMESRVSTEDFEFMSYAGYQIKYNIKVAAGIGINTYDYLSKKEYQNSYIKDTLNKIYTTNYQIKSGMLLDLNEFFSIGVSIGTICGTTKYIENNKFLREDDNLKVVFNFLPEYKIIKSDDTKIWRFYLSVLYESIISYLNEYYLWFDEDESYYNLNTEWGIGLYYGLQNKTIVTWGVKLNWIIDNKSKIYNKNQIDTDDYNGINLNAYLGLEKSVIFDWLFIRFNYNFLKIKNYHHCFYREQNNYLISEYKKDEFELTFLPEFANNINFGAGLHIGNNFYLNFNFGKKLFNLNVIKNEINKVNSGFELEINFIFE